MGTCGRKYATVCKGLLAAAGIAALRSNWRNSGSALNGSGTNSLNESSGKTAMAVEQCQSAGRKRQLVPLTERACLTRSSNDCKGDMRGKMRDGLQRPGCCGWDSRDPFKRPTTPATRSTGRA